MQLGLDAGATSTKWSLADGDRILARGTGPALTGHVYTETQQDDAARRLHELRARITAACPDPDVEAIVAGVTGLGAAEPSARIMRTLLARAFQLPEAAVEVHNDLHLTYLAYHTPGSGILLYAGTGSIAYHLDARGEPHRAGGHGYLLGDEGGALWLARESLRQLLRRREEGLEAPPILTAHLGAALGSLDWPTLRAQVYGRERGELAALAPLITAAAQEGDPVARGVLTDGARELARLVSCLARLSPTPLPVTACGGAISEGLLPLLGAHLSHHTLVRGQRRVSDDNALRPLQQPERERQA